MSKNASDCSSVCWPCQADSSKLRPANYLEQKECLGGLLPQHGIVSPKPLKGAVVNVAQAKKAIGQVSDRHRRGAAKRRFIYVV
jgi:hypothetical protein